MQHTHPEKKIKAIKNNYSVRINLPKLFVKRLDLNPGDELSATLIKDEIIIKKKWSRKNKRNTTKVVDKQ